MCHLQTFQNLNIHIGIKEQMHFFQINICCIYFTDVDRYQPGAYPGFCGMKRLEVFLPPPPPPPLDGMLVHHRVTPSINLASTHLYTWVGVVSQNTAQCPQPGLEPRLLDIQRPVQ